MPKVIEAVYENGVFKPLEKVELREGTKVKVEIKERELKFKPIKLKKKISLKEIEDLRDELWIFS